MATPCALPDCRGFSRGSSPYCCTQHAEAAAEMARSRPRPRTCAICRTGLADIFALTCSPACRARLVTLANAVHPPPGHPTDASVGTPPVEAVP
jgi:hypothetical protein